MKNSKRAPSATSLPRAPRDDVGARSTRYLVMMGVRIACLVAMVLITPYGWYTWLLGAAAIFLPYIAVVSANVGQEARRNRREDPEPALPPAPAHPSAAAPRVIRVEETPHATDPHTTDPRSSDTGADAPRRATPAEPPRPDEAA